MSETESEYQAGPILKAEPVVPHVAIEQPAVPVDLEHLGMVALPPGWEAHDVGKGMPRPRRPMGTMAAASAEALLALVKRFGAPDRALVLLQAKPTDLLNGQPTVVTAYFDIGYSGHVGWADWNGVLRLDPVSALKRLLAFVKTGGDHKALVRLLDSLVPYLVEPSAAVIHDAFMKLNLTKQVQFKRAEDLANGDVVLSVETVTGAQTEAGRVRLPETVSFSLPVFVGMAAVWELEFKLRYQLKDESCTFRLECDDLEDQAASLLGAILEELQSTFNGSAQVVAGSM